MGMGSECMCSGLCQHELECVGVGGGRVLVLVLVLVGCDMCALDAIIHC